MLLSCHQNAGQNHDIERGNRCFGNVEQFRYLGTTKTNQNLIQEEIKRLVDLSLQPAPPKGVAVGGVLG
jgi:hypothetical protein